MYVESTKSSYRKDKKQDLRDNTYHKAKCFLRIFASKTRTWNLKVKAEAFSAILRQHRDFSQISSPHAIVSVLERIISKRQTLFLAEVTSVVRKIDGLIALFKSLVMAVRRIKTERKNEAWKMIQETEKSTLYRMHFQQKEMTKSYIERTEKSARILGAILQKIFFEKRRQIWAKIRIFAAEFDRRKPKTLYAKMRHLVKPVSPARGVETFENILSRSMILEKSVSRSGSTVQHSPLLTRQRSKVSFCEFASTHSPIKPSFAEKKILLDRFLKKQALRSPSKNRLPKKSEQPISVSSQFKSFREHANGPLTNCNRFNNEDNLLRKSTSFVSPHSLCETAVYCSARGQPPQTAAPRKKDSLVHPKTFYNSFFGKPKRTIPPDEKQKTCTSREEPPKKGIFKPDSFTKSFHTILLNEAKPFRK